MEAAAAAPDRCAERDASDGCSLGEPAIPDDAEEEETTRATTTRPAARFSNDEAAADCTTTAQIDERGVADYDREASWEGDNTEGHPHGGVFGQYWYTQQYIDTAENGGGGAPKYYMHQQPETPGSVFNGSEAEFYEAEESLPDDDGRGGASSPLSTPPA